MEPKLVDVLERTLEEAVADAVVKLGRNQLPHRPARQTIHLMAKAAVAVYEAVVDAHDANP